VPLFFCYFHSTLSHLHN